MAVTLGDGTDRLPQAHGSYVELVCTTLDSCTPACGSPHPVHDADRGREPLSGMTNAWSMTHGPMLCPSWIDQGGVMSRSEHGRAVSCRSRRRPSPTSPSGPGSRGRPSPTRSTTPTCCAPTPSSGSARRIAELGYSPNRAARNLRTRTSSLIGLRFKPAQEGTANALMDRFVHSLVEASAAAGYHVLLFTERRRRRDRRATTTCSARPPSTPSWSPTPISATRRPPGSAEQRAPFVVVRPAVGRQRRAAPVGGRRRRRRHPPGHPAPHRSRPHPDRLDRLAQGLADRRGPARRAGSRRCTPTACRPPASPRGSRTSC